MPLLVHRACLVRLLLLLTLAALPASAATVPQTSAAPGPDALATDADLDRLLDESQRAFEQGQAAQGTALLDDVLAKARRDGLPRYEAEAERRLALGDARAGRPDAARERLTRAIPLFSRAGDRRGEARSQLQLGSLFYDSDKPAAAAALREAWATFQALDDAAGMLDAAAVLVYLLGDAEDRDERSRIREAALAVAPRARPSHSECSIRHEWADELFGEGRLSDAYTQITGTIDCFRQTRSRSAEGRALVSRGRIYRAHGRLTLALEQYKQALALQEGADDGDPVAAIQSMNAIAVTLGHLGRGSEALPWYENALARARAAAPASAQNALLGNLGGAYLALGRFVEARLTLLESLEREKNPMLRATRYSQLGRALLGLGDRETALAFADKSVAASESLGPETQMVAHENRATILIDLGRFAEAERDLRLCAEIIERLRAKTIAADAMKRGFHNWHQGIFATLIDLLGRQGQAEEALAVSERARARAFLDLLAARSANPRRAEPATPNQVAAAARRLRSTIAAYWVGETAVSIWVIPPEGAITLTRVPVLRARLTELVRQASGLQTEEAPGGLLVTDRAQRAPWRELHRLLVAPIARALPTRPGSRLTIVPHGPLFGLSFAGLIDSAGRHLVEQYDVHYVPAAALLVEPPVHGAPAGTALLVGDPGALPGEPGIDPLPALPWARREVTAVRRGFGAGATLLSDDAVTEARVREAARGRRVLHFATHGIVRNDESAASYLALRPGGGHDGRLTADEVYGMDLDADLVVLSACRSALGPIGGDGVIGFTRAFLTAGARSVVATQWDVSDRASYELMREFYARRRAGASTSRALRGAQLAVLASLRKGLLTQDGQPLPAAPQLWAGFVLVGEP